MNIDDPATIPDSLKNRKYAAGMYSSPDEFPEAAGKTYLFLAAGADLIPHPSQFLPGPDDFTVTDQKSYHVWNKKNPYSTTLGWTAWHEKGHHGEGGKINDEWHADNSAISGITVAWEYYQKTGDNSKYPFVFITDEGVIITKKINQREKDPLIF